jgi:outer membrane protein assembly factor BamD (BamD/ComL family)
MKMIAPFLWILFAAPLFAEPQEIPIEEVLPMEEQEGPSVQEFYSFMQEAIDDEDWWSAVDFGQIVLYHFPDSPFGQEIPFCLGMAYLKLNQHELANESLTEYLKKSSNPKHFEEAIDAKFAIAEYFREGGKKRLFGSHKLPAIIPGKEDSLPIYEEIIASIPHHELAAKALLGKAEIQAYCEDYRPSVETLHLLIRRFPKHELAAESYLRINKVYLTQAETLHLDPDLLDLAEVNLRKFRLAFPREPRIADAEVALSDMKEIFAQNLLETGEFYQRRKQPDASIIYFSKVVAKYPKSLAADSARAKLVALQESGHF